MSTIARSIPVPHYHVVLRQGYRIWTYTHPVKAPRQIRHLTEHLFSQGHRPLILQCDREHCRIYAHTYKAEDIQQRINAIRPTDDSYVQIYPAPQ